MSDEEKSDDGKCPEGFHYAAIENFSKLSDREVRTYALGLVEVLEHLRLNIKESEENDNYRRREAIRSQIAINTINKFLHQAEENFEIILDRTKN
jgi:hypothetical protein